MMTATSLYMILVATLVTVHVRVFAHAAVDAPTLDLAKVTARELLATAGAALSWRTCGAVEDDCSPPDDPAEVIVLLMPLAKMVRDDVSAEVIRDPTTRAPTVLVYLPNLVDRLRAVRQSADSRSNPALAGLELGHLVGLAIAHELGHAFGLPHSPLGVMKAPLEPADLIALRSSRLTFASPLTAGLHARLRRETPRLPVTRTAGSPSRSHHRPSPGS